MRKVSPRLEWAAVDVVASLGLYQKFPRQLTDLTNGWCARSMGRLPRRDDPSGNAGVAIRSGRAAVADDIALAPNHKEAIEVIR
jgi:hypothetical protein